MILLEGGTIAKFPLWGETIVKMAIGFSFRIKGTLCPAGARAHRKILAFTYRFAIATHVCAARGSLAETIANFVPANPTPSKGLKV